MLPIGIWVCPCRQGNEEGQHGKIIAHDRRLFILAGLIWMAGDALGIGKFLGHLPGDISFTRGNTSFSFPIVTCIIISVILTIVLNLFFRL